MKPLNKTISGLPLLFALCLAATAARGQNTESEPKPHSEIESLRQELQRMNARLEAGTRREETLLDRVSALEINLHKEREDRDARIAELEERAAPSEISERIAAFESSLNPAFIQAQSHSAVSVGGYFDIEFRDDEASRNTTFDQHRFILQFDADIHPGAITFHSELEIEGGGADASFLSGNEIVVEFAELHFHIIDEFNVKAGALLVPFGRFNRLHDSPLRDLTDRPLVDRRIIPTTWTDAAVGIFGVFELFEGLTIDYDIILGNGLDDGFSSTAGGGFRGARNSFRSDNNDNKMVIGRIGITPELSFLDHANVGFSFGFGKYDDDDKRDIEMIGLDWTFKKGPFELIGEFASFNLDRGPEEIDAGVPGGADGFYAQLNFHFFPESWIGSTSFFTEESTFTLVFRFGTIDTDDSARAIDRALRGDSYRDDLVRYTIGLNFRPIEKTVIKLEYQIFDEKGGVDDADNNRLVFSVASYF